jgi:hypothetical protein
MKQAIKIQEILRELEDIPTEKLEQIELYIKTVLSERPKKKKVEEPKTLGGIWENKGFEKIVDIEDEIKTLRKELGHQLLNRKL